MKSRVSCLAAGAGAYLALVLVLYGFYLLAFPGGRGGAIPVWFASVQLIVEALTAVVPGLVAGWLSRGGGLTNGLIVGALGSIGGAVTLAILWGPVPFEQQLLVGTLAAAIGASLTNAVGGSAGQFLRSQLLDRGTKAS